MLHKTADAPSVGVFDLEYTKLAINFRCEVPNPIAGQNQVAMFPVVVQGDFPRSTIKSYAIGQFEAFVSIRRAQPRLQQTIYSILVRRQKTS